METLFTEFRLATRRLLRARMVTVLALLTLGLGIGANTAIFTVVNAVLLRPLPFPEPDRLVRVYRLREGATGPGHLSAPAFLGFRDRARVFATIAVFDTGEPTLTGDGEPTRLNALQISEDFFETFRVRLLLGRTITRQDNQSGSEPVVILSEELWSGRFAGDANILGRQITLDGRAHTVIGVAPAQFSKAHRASLFTAIEYDYDFRDPANFYAHFLSGVARLKPGISIESAEQDAKRVYQELQNEYRMPNSRTTAVVLPLQAQVVRDVRTPLLVLLGAVGLVLLIACANLANLLLASAAARWSEFAVRRSLGASDERLIGQLLIESLVLGLSGGVIGLIVGAWGSALLGHMLPQSAAQIAEITVDGSVLAFTAAVAICAALLFGLAPALQISRAGPARLLADIGRGGVGSRRGNRVRSALVVTETALAVMLLVGAGLLLRSFASLQHVDPGFNAEQVLSIDLALPDATYDETAEVGQFYATLIERISNMPGVTSAGATMLLPLIGTNMRLTWKEAGEPDPEPGQEKSMGVRITTPGYFDALGIPLVRGRLFDDRERADGPMKVLLSEAAVARFFPEQNPIGKRIELGWTIDSKVIGGEVIGIVGSVRLSALEEEAEPEIYLAHAQIPQPGMSVVARTTGQLAALTAQIRRTVHELDANLAISNVRSLEDVVDASLAPRRYYTVLIGAFAMIAMLLAAVGIFGVISLMVAQRRREIGVRVALGAAPQSILRMVVGGALRMVGLGLVIGIAGALLLTGVLRSLLFGVTTTDPVTLVVSATLLLLSALAASAFPAWNAARVDPLVALRSD